MSLRRRTRGETGLHKPTPATNIQTVSLPITCNLVKPRCTEYRTFNTEFHKDHSGITLLISEAKQRSRGPNPAYLWIHHQVSVPGRATSHNGERFVGKPMVIACHGEHLVLQSVTDRGATIKFLYVNTVNKSAQIIQDDICYFPRDLVLQGAVECHISPDLSCVLFCLPQCMRTIARTSKVLVARTETNPEDGLRIKPLSDSIATGLNLRKHTTMSFNPNKECEIVTIRADNYCRVCHISTGHFTAKVDIASETAIPMDKSDFVPADVRINHMQAGEVDAKDGDLLQCDLDYCKSGDLAIFIALSHLSNINRLQLKYVLLATESWNILKNIWLFPCLDQSIYSNMNSSIISSHTDCTDTQVSFWLGVRHKVPVKMTCDFNMPRSLNLQHACRIAILKNCLPLDISQLPLPSKLVQFMQFKHMPVK